MSDRARRLFLVPNNAFGGRRGHTRRAPMAAIPAREVEQTQSIVGQDAAYAFVLMSSAIFLPRLESLGALLFVVCPIALIWIRPTTSMRAVRENWLLLLFPTLTIVSTVWSATPDYTLKHSIEYLLTIVAALLLASPKNPRAMLFGIFAAFALYAVASITLGSMVNVGNDGVTALAGLDDSKNSQAGTVSMGLVASAAMFLISLRDRRILLAAFALAAGLVEFYAAIAARSVGAMAALAAALASFSLLFVLGRTGRHTRLSVIGIGGIVVLGLAFFFMTFTNSCVHWLATEFGKDATLTGRTYLWTRADDLTAQQPLVGMGFGAFWQRGNLDAEGLWRFAHIASREGFNFHNTVYDVLVALGWVGLVTFLLTLLVGFARTAAAYIAEPTLIDCFWLSIGIYTTILMPFETNGIYEFSESTVLLFAMLGAGRVQRSFTSSLTRTEASAFA